MDPLFLKEIRMQLNQGCSRPTIMIEKYGNGLASILGVVGFIIELDIDNNCLLSCWTGSYSGSTKLL